MNAFISAYLNGGISIDGLAAKLGTRGLQEAESELTALAQRAAHAAAYLMRRGAAGCGDDGHSEALEYANKQLQPLRKALGYTYP